MYLPGAVGRDSRIVRSAGHSPPLSERLYALAPQTEAEATDLRQERIKVPVSL